MAGQLGGDRLPSCNSVSVCLVVTLLVDPHHTYTWTVFGVCLLASACLFRCPGWTRLVSLPAVWPGSMELKGKGKHRGRRLRFLLFPQL